MSERADSSSLLHSAAKDAVAPKNFKTGFVAERGSDEYSILLASLDNRSDRSWWPTIDPDHFICKRAPGKWNRKNMAWFPVFEGREYEWSYLKGFKKSVSPKLAQAARYEVETQVEGLRRGGFHLHHDELSFSEILRAFCDVFGLSKDEIALEIGEKSGEVWFKCPYISAFWRVFHTQNATLKLISIDDHKRIHSATGSWK